MRKIIFGCIKVTYSWLCWACKLMRGWRWNVGAVSRGTMLLGNQISKRSRWTGDEWQRNDAVGELDYNEKLFGR